jgi:hypothetical protein
MRALVVIGVLAMAGSVVNAEPQRGYMAYRAFLQAHEPPRKVRQWWDRWVRDLDVGGFEFDPDKKLLMMTSGPHLFRFWVATVEGSTAFVLQDGNGKLVGVPLAKFRQPKVMMYVGSLSDHPNFLDLETGYPIEQSEGEKLRKSFRMQLFYSRLADAGVINRRFETPTGKKLRALSDAFRKLRPRPR